MNLTKKQIDENNLTLTIEVAAADYAEAEKKRLNEDRRRADIKGFRRGMAPASLIKRLYGAEALYQSVNSVVSEALNNFIREEKIRVVGEPLPSIEQPENVWESGKDFSFSFDIAWTPELKFEIGKDDKIVYYDINITDAAKKEAKKNLLQQYGSLQEGAATKEEDYIIADISNGEHSAEGVYVSVRNVAEAARSMFIGLKAGDKVTVDVNEAFENETDRTSMLKLTKEQLAATNPSFTFTVVNVKTFVPASEGEETWNRIYGEGVVKTAEEFEAKIEEQLRADRVREADYRFSRDAREYFIGKAALTLPEAFLKRWLIETNEGKYSAEQVEKEFPAFIEDFKWQLVRGYILQKFSVKIEQSDLEAAAESYAAYQYAMYGMGNVPIDMIKDFAKRILADENQARRIEEQVEDNKAFEALKGAVTLQHKKISEDKFRAL